MTSVSSVPPSIKYFFHVWFTIFYTPPLMLLHFCCISSTFSPAAENCDVMGCLSIPGVPKCRFLTMVFTM